MLKKFTECLVFGSGFGIAFLTLWYVAAYVVSPMLFSSKLDNPAADYSSSQNAKPQMPALPSPEKFTEPASQFHELNYEEQIKKASVIALARYERSPDGRMKAIIKDFLKKDPGTEIHYKVGDEYASSSYSPKPGTNYGDGVIIFFVDSPAQMKLAMTFEGDRIRGLGDLPLELFTNKCKAPKA